MNRIVGEDVEDVLGYKCRYQRSRSEGKELGKRVDKVRTVSCKHSTKLTLHEVYRTTCAVFVI
jgi:hypothetical protein